MVFVVAAVAWVPSVDAVVLWVEVAAFGGAVVGWGLLVAVEAFRLLELILLMGVQMQVLGQIPVVSSAEVLAVVLLCGM